MIARRSLLLAALGAPAMMLGTQALAQVRGRAPQPKIDVVKVVSFGCPISRGSEAVDGALADKVKELGGNFVFSPFPVEQEANSLSEVLKKSCKERVYFASRKFGVVIADTIKASLFKGAQDMGLPLQTYQEVYTWLTHDAPGIEQYFSDIFLLAQEDAAGDSVRKVAYIAQQAGTRSLPSYVLIVDGKIKPALGPDDVPGGSIPKVRDKVIESINNHLKKA